MCSHLHAPQLHPHQPRHTAPPTPRTNHPPLVSHDHSSHGRAVDLIANSLSSPPWPFRQNPNPCQVLLHELASSCPLPSLCVSQCPLPLCASGLVLILQCRAAPFPSPSLHALSLFPLTWLPPHHDLLSSCKFAFLLFIFFTALLPIRVYT